MTRLYWFSAVVLGVTVPLSGAPPTTTTTDAAGTCAFHGLCDGSYMLVPSFPLHAFTPASRAFRISGADVAGQDFMAQP